MSLNAASTSWTQQHTHATCTAACMSTCVIVPVSLACDARADSAASTDGHPLVEDEVVAAEEAAFGLLLEVCMNAAGQLKDLGGIAVGSSSASGLTLAVLRRCFLAGISAEEQSEKLARTLAADTPCTIHHHLLAMHLL